MLIGIFESTDKFNNFVAKNNYKPKVGDKFLITGKDQTTFENDGMTRRNLEKIDIQGDKGERGERGKDGENAKEIDYKQLRYDLFEKLRNDPEFISKTRGFKGERGRDGRDGRDAEDIDRNALLRSLFTEFVGSEEYKSLQGVDGKDGHNGIDGNTRRTGDIMFFNRDGDLFLNENTFEIFQQRNGKPFLMGSLKIQ